MRSHNRNKLIAVLLTILAVCMLCACSSWQAKEGPSSGRGSLEPVNTPSLTEEDKLHCQNALADFAFRLARETKKDAGETENTLISPVSVAMALTMAANGAKEQTLEEMLRMLVGEGADLDMLNSFLAVYLRQLPNTKNARLELANSIWIRNDDSLKLDPEFLQFNQRYYGALIKKADFNAKTITEINRWVSMNTAGLIDKIIEEIPDDTVLYLINALVFDGVWSNPYKDSAIEEEAIFFNQDGSAATVTKLHSEESCYLENDAAYGTLKNYKDGYVYIALLPKEGKTIDDLLASLEGDNYYKLFSNSVSGVVYFQLPEYSCTASYDLIPSLENLGMHNAFSKNGGADFSGIGLYDGRDLYICEVTHKTRIEVDRNGTKAAAVTSVGMAPESMGPPQEIYEVDLNRPFVYIIADRKTLLPIFIGSECTMN